MNSFESQLKINEFIWKLIVQQEGSDNSDESSIKMPLFPSLTQLNGLFHLKIN